MTTDHLVPNTGYLMMDQSSFSMALNAQDSCAMAELGFERLNRKPNFSSKETQFIIDMVAKFKPVLRERALDSGTNERKRGIWQMICDGVNEMTPGVIRSVEEIRKRWQNLNCTARKEAAKLRKYQTEGFDLAPPPMSSVSMQILGLSDEHDDSMDENGQNSDLVVQSMKIEIDLATDASDENSMSDFPNFSELSESPPNCNEGFKNENDSVGATSTSASKLLTQPSPETICSNSVPPKSSSQSTNMSCIQKTKVVSSGSSSSSHSSHQVTYSAKRPQELSHRLPSSTTSNQNGSFARSLKTQMSNEIEIVDNFTANPSCSNGIRSSDGPKKRRMDDQYFRIQDELLANERDSLALEREKVQLEREKLNMEQEQLAVELQKVLMEKEKLNLEKEVEREKLRMEREKISLEVQQERQKLVLERGKLDLARDQERSRLKFDQEKLDIEKEKVALEQEKLTLEIRYWRRRLLQTQSAYDSNPVNGGS